MAVNERLFREELDYLRRYGKLMARENPRLEKFLATQGTDPGGGAPAGGVLSAFRPVAGENRG
ncbi:hypothetical protein [Salmonella enterica]|uniref:hypothetical protein n=1 Tax=Salmonella enterica TaxID=28901 RepID=UPI000A4E347F|nr:type VI secretion protein, family [Salmonella enterica subsp. salamae]